ncbi:MAG: hypothetical protein WCW27_05825 [Patescibacteria group bacterium]|jgi:hypothetical protein
MEVKKKSGGCFNVLRWVLGVLLLLQLGFVIVVGVPTAAVLRTLTNREHIKIWFEQAGIYNNPIDTISTIIIKKAPADSAVYVITQQAQDKNSQTRMVVDKIIYPEFLRTSIITLINATYDWLEGKTAKPIFNITLISDPALLTQLVATIDTNNILNQVGVNTVDNSELNNILEKTKITGDQLPIDTNTTAMAQEIFTLGLLIPGIILAVLLTLISLTIIVIPSYKRSSIVVGCVLMVVGGFIALSQWAIAASFAIISNFILTATIPNDAAWVNTVFGNILRLAYQDMLRRTMHYGIAVTLAGVVAIIIGALAHLKSAK